MPHFTTRHNPTHDRYRNLLDNSPQSHARLLQLLHAESQLLLAGIPRLARKRAALYRSLRELVPYVGYRDGHTIDR